jgi:hypothetical protein
MESVRRSAPSPALSSPAQFAIESWIYGKLNRRLFWVCNIPMVLIGDNFCSIHATPKAAPAMAAGVSAPL